MNLTIPCFAACLNALRKSAFKESKVFIIVCFCLLLSVVFNRSFVAVDNGLETTSSMLWDNETTPDIEFIDSELYGIKDNRLHSDDKNSYFYESMDGIFSKINNLTKLSYVEDNCIFNL